MRFTVTYAPIENYAKIDNFPHFAVEARPDNSPTEPAAARKYPLQIAIISKCLDSPVSPVVGLAKIGEIVSPKHQPASFFVRKSAVAVSSRRRNRSEQFRR